MVICMRRINIEMPHLITLYDVSFLEKNNADIFGAKTNKMTTFDVCFGFHKPPNSNSAYRSPLYENTSLGGEGVFIKIQMSRKRASSGSRRAL